MSKWKDTGEWSEWQCAICGCNQSDPDSLTVTSCANGHTNYLGPAYDNRGKHRKAFRTARERTKDLREHEIMMEVFSAAFKQK